MSAATTPRASTTGLYSGCIRVGGRVIWTGPHVHANRDRVLARFLAYVVTGYGGGGAHGECWIWTGWTSHDGYGRFRCNGKNQRAHRVAHEMLRGPIPDGLQLDHLCRVRNCVNPAHLEPVTQRENIIRGVAPTVLLHREGRCKRGHVFAEVGTHRNGDGRGSCAECRRTRDRARCHVLPSVEAPVAGAGR